jgi:ATP-dependent 26S proteasome regulatory subunit
LFFSDDFIYVINLQTDEQAKAGSGTQFEGESLGIGGLDDVLAQVKRRVWIPLAAPPSLLEELGIHPVRGLLLYGKPGCGKTLLARTLGKILSPMRPITVVSGPEIMDKFVGSSEKVRKSEAPCIIFRMVKLIVLTFCMRV